jgi:hypothetical protein
MKPAVFLIFVSFSKIISPDTSKPNRRCLNRALPAIFAELGAIFIKTNIDLDKTEAVASR